MKVKLILLVLFALTVSCRHHQQLAPLQWNYLAEAPAEYAPYLKPGTGKLTGQAFLAQNGGGVVKAAGRTVTLDPATQLGREWWNQAGMSWMRRGVTPPGADFYKGRRTTTADADGRFKFDKLPAGKYYVRTEVTWMVGDYSQGGLVGQLVEVRENEESEVILSKI